MFYKPTTIFIIIYIVSFLLPHSKKLLTLQIQYSNRNAYKTLYVDFSPTDVRFSFSAGIPLERRIRLLF